MTTSLSFASAGTLSILATVAGSFFSLSTASAQATVTWGPAQDTSGPADVAAGGTVVEARNGLVFSSYLVGDPAFDVTNGGVAFEGINFLGKQFPNEPPGSFIANHTSGDAAYDTMLSNASSCDGPTLGNGSVNENAFYQISGLTVNEDYLIQIWYCDVRGASDARSVTIDGSTVIESGINSDPNDLGQFAVGTFTATATTQLVNIDAAGTSMRAAISAIMVRVNDGGGFGTNYCGPAVANSTGASATISAAGSLVATDNNITLTASDMPTTAFGFFITSQGQASIAMPGGSAGTLCLGGAIGRYVGAGQIQNTGSLGEFSLALDLTLHPQPTGFVTVAAGETWNFQAWFRDSVGGSATSNFTNGLELSFQ